MSNPREGPNPLRPYYIPPSIGLPPTPVAGATSTGTTHGVGLRNGTTASYASSAREMFTDIDYSDYLTESSPSSVDTVRRLLDEAVYRYFSVLLAQPFDVAKTILQVRKQASIQKSAAQEAIFKDLHSPSPSYGNSIYIDVRSTIDLCR